MIRKQNSDFVTAFTSESGGNLKNSDCFAFVELDGFACYILADGIEDVSGANAAKICVDAVVTAFTESPSMKKGALKKYMRFAHKALQTAKTKEKLKASVTILVHNYVKLRYCQSGNIRFRLYRNGFLKFESKDQSLSSDLVDSHKLEKDKLITHAERHNLYSYVGQEKHFSPKVSKKIKMTSADAISLTTRGFWENVDEGELLDLFQDAGTDPKETVRTAEDMLLSKQPENLRAFTFATIFVNKTFIDPTKKQKWKRFITFAIPICTILFIVGMIYYSRWRTKQNNIATMEEYFQQSVSYMTANNYVRGESTLEETIVYANKVKDTDMYNLATEYLMLVQRIISADNSLSAYDFHTAHQSYVDCLTLSRSADLHGIDYIIDKLDLTLKYIEVYDLISLGDTLTLNLQYSEAESKYMEARILAGKIYFDTGRQNAVNGLETLYELQKSQAEQIQSATTALVELETSAASFMAQGDTAYGNSDLESALIFYGSAMQKYEELGDSNNVNLAAEKIVMVKSKQDDAILERTTAESYVSLGKSEQVLEKFANAKRFYLLAKDVYETIGDSAKATEMDNLVEIVVLLESIQLEELAESEAEAEIKRLEDEILAMIAEKEAEEVAKAEEEALQEALKEAEDAAKEEAQSEEESQSEEVFRLEDLIEDSLSEEKDANEVPSTTEDEPPSEATFSWDDYPDDVIVLG